MGLYICVFDPTDDEELDGVEVGTTRDFGFFRETVSERLEGAGRRGSRFPTLMGHDGVDGEWAPDEAAALVSELETTRLELAALAPLDADTCNSGMMEDIEGEPSSLAESFLDINGDLLVDRLLDIARLAAAHHLPVSFQ